MASLAWRPASSHIGQVDFDESTDTLTIEFTDGRTYDYLNVPAQVARQFQAAGSAGQFFHRHIRGRYAEEEQ